MFRQLFRKRFYFFIPIIIITAWLALHLLPASLSQLLPQSLSFSAPVKTADSKFRTYTRELFRQELSGNTLSLHYTLIRPLTAYRKRTYRLALTMSIRKRPVPLRKMRFPAYILSIAENYPLKIRSHTIFCNIPSNPQNKMPITSGMKNRCPR